MKLFTPVCFRPKIHITLSSLNLVHKFSVTIIVQSNPIQSYYCELQLVARTQLRQYGTAFFKGENNGCDNKNRVNHLATTNQNASKSRLFLLRVSGLAYKL